MYPSYNVQYANDYPIVFDIANFNIICVGFVKGSLVHKNKEIKIIIIGDPLTTYLTLEINCKYNMCITKKHTIGKLCTLRSG